MKLIQTQLIDGFVINTYNNGTIEKYYATPPDEELSEPTETELIQAELLLNQAEIMSKQIEHDEVLAAILLNQQEG